VWYRIALLNFSAYRRCPADNRNIDPVTTHNDDTSLSVASLKAVSGDRTTKRVVRLLLINPRFPESFWSFRWAVNRILPGMRALNPPLGLATIAALCPVHWEIEIVDENVEPVPLDPAVDLIGICGMAIQYPRQRELLDYYRQRGYYVVAGGSYVSLCPERYENLVDTIVVGESEYTWPAFCRQFEQGVPLAAYRENGTVDLADSPVPRFDLLKLDRYATIPIQFSRGCPYRCEFCDIIVMFGRRPRTKEPEQIGRELDRLRALKVRNVFFVDDNLIGNKRKAKQLLRYLVDYQKRHDWPFHFGTEASLNLAEDEELLRLLREASFSWVFIGIESPDQASLEESKKTQNTRTDILASVRRIYRHGIDVFAGFIIGFDNDTTETFERQHRFILDSGILVAMVGLLTALPRTPLYQRLEQAGRLITDHDTLDNTKPGTNIIPKRMGSETMVEHYKALYTRLVDDREIARRIRNKMRYLQNPVYQGGYCIADSCKILRRLLVRGILPGGLTRVARFAHTLAGNSPRTWPQIISDWITGLAIRDYVQRYFGIDPARERQLAEQTLGFIRRTYAAQLYRGHLEVSLIPSHTVNRLALTLRTTIDPSFFTGAARRLEKLLRSSAATVTLHLKEFKENQPYQLDRLLRRLSRYGDRVSLELDETLRRNLTTDLSLFHLRL
jgi:radical SAM superfamily enzyme YgiQ (UPF0313 family)